MGLRLAFRSVARSCAINQPASTYGSFVVHDAMSAPRRVQSAIFFG